MTELTREQIENARKLLKKDYPHDAPWADALCDLALQALDGEEMWIASHGRHATLDPMPTEQAAWKAVQNFHGDGDPENDFSIDALKRHGWTVSRCRIVRV